VVLKKHLAVEIDCQAEESPHALPLFCSEQELKWKQHKGRRWVSTVLPAGRLVMALNQCGKHI